MQVIKIKMEVDTDPPGLFNTETKFLLQPIPFSLRGFVKSDLFAGKIHALLCRAWMRRIKGRDWTVLFNFLTKKYFKAPLSSI
jgi:hypothetical protein